jgi:uncharacterized protein
LSERPKYDGFVPGRHLIDAYGGGGFRFADMSHKGSILLLPSGVHAWPVTDFSGVTPASLKPLFAEPKGTVELLLLGVGTEMRFAPELLKSRLREAGIRLEVMQTGAAARTYNILVGENRKVAAALIAVD